MAVFTSTRCAIANSNIIDVLWYGAVVVIMLLFPRSDGRTIGLTELLFFAAIGLIAGCLVVVIRLCSAAPPFQAADHRCPIEVLLSGAPPAVLMVLYYVAFIISPNSIAKKVSDLSVLAIGVVFGIYIGMCTIQIIANLVGEPKRRRMSKAK